MLEINYLLLEEHTKKFYQDLSEKDRRQFAAIIAMQRGKNGVSYASDLLGCDGKTVRRGISEFQSDSAELPKERIRQEGGGRKSKLDDEDLNLAFQLIMELHTAGDPMDETVKWTNLTCSEIALKLKKVGYKVSRRLVKKLLSTHDYKHRKMLHNKTIKPVEGRDEQFEAIETLRASFMESDDPIISMDTKKKGNVRESTSSRQGVLQ